MGSAKDVVYKIEAVYVGAGMYEKQKGVYTVE